MSWVTQRPVDCDTETELRKLWTKHAAPEFERDDLKNHQYTPISSNINATERWMTNILTVMWMHLPQTHLQDE